MSSPVESRYILYSGLVFLTAALALQTTLREMVVWTLGLTAVGMLLTVWGMFLRRAELGAMMRRRRTEIALHTLGVIGVLIALAYLSVRYPFHVDLTKTGWHSLSEQTVTMLRRLQKPVHIVFFRDPLLHRTVQLYELVAAQSALITVEFYDPMLNPAQARLRGVQFAGTAVMTSEGRTLKVHGGSETDIANGILRVSQGAKHLVCFLDGHGEADPFSMESHDHLEGGADHTHGLGAQYVLHERHGMAKARHALETFNYEVAKVSLVRHAETLAGCAVLVVAGPKVPLLPAEVAAVRAYLLAGGDAFFMLDPFVHSGLEPVLQEFGVVVDDTIVIDRTHHFWADIASPAVTSYNRHQVTRELPLTFYPGVRSLSPTPEPVPGISVIPLVNASKQSFGETTASHAAFDAGRDQPGPLTLMVLVTRRPVVSGTRTTDAGTHQDGNRGLPRSVSPDGVLTQLADRSRIAVVGDSDFATNSFFHILGNGNLFLNTINYLAAQDNLIGIEPRTYDLPRVNLTNRQMQATFFLTVLLIPFLLAVVGTVVWWRQR